MKRFRIRVCIYHCFFLVCKADASVLHILRSKLYRQTIDSARIDISYWFAARLQEEQVARVRQGMSERVQQLESQIQGKLEQARERRETIEREQKEKLRNHVSFFGRMHL